MTKLARLFDTARVERRGLKTGKLGILSTARHLAGETTDVETGMVSSEFLISGTGEYLTSRPEKSKSSFSPMGFVEVVLRGTVLLFLVPQVPKEFCRGWPMCSV
jgi:hypothetical protein